MNNTMAISQRMLLLGAALTLGLVAMAGFRSAPVANAPAKAAAAPAPITVAAYTAKSHYYDRLSRGELGDMNVLYGLFTPDFRVRDKNDGC